ncbi:hypothetical protein Goari_018255, partial [Gossypium aridum]|nr:hypothetical protein [Gossypium aridum]
VDYEAIFGRFAYSSWEGGGLRGQFEEGRAWGYMQLRVHIDILSPLKRNKKISLLKGVNDVSLWATTRSANPPISIWLFKEDKFSLPILEEIMHDKGEGISSDDEIGESQDVGLDEMGFDTKEMVRSALEWGTGRNETSKLGHLWVGESVRRCRYKHGFDVAPFRSIGGLSIGWKEDYSVWICGY